MVGIEPAIIFSAGRMVKYRTIPWLQTKYDITVSGKANHFDTKMWPQLSFDSLISVMTMFEKSGIWMYQYCCVE
jgi:hypothetical protein